MKLIDSLIAPVVFYFNSKGDKELVLRSILKNHPLWAKGHFLLSQELLEKRQISASYVSVEAAKTLGYDRAETLIIEAKIYLQVGEIKKVIDLLLPYCNSQSSTIDPRIAEELVAAYMHCEEYKLASDVLNLVSKEVSKNPALKVAQEFVLSKISH